jgi:HEPN domain-containing protein
MARKRLSPTDPHEWLRRAHSNLARAKQRIPQACLEDLCFDCQQAAEKAIKAVFIHTGSAFPFIHDLARLLTLLQRAGVKIHHYLRRAQRLTRFAIENVIRVSPIRSRRSNIAGPFALRMRLYAGRNGKSASREKIILAAENSQVVRDRLQHGRLSY